MPQRINFHGGKCCGVKIISGFYHSPSGFAGSIKETSVSSNDFIGDHVSSMQNFFHLEAPSETGKDRLDRFLRYLRVRRPKGLVEVVLQDYGGDEDGYCSQVKNWEPILKSRGFKKVGAYWNSNSGNRCHVYHLAMDYDLCCGVKDPFSLTETKRQEIGFKYEDSKWDLPKPKRVRKWAPKKEKK